MSNQRAAGTHGACAASFTAIRLMSGTRMDEEGWHLGDMHRRGRLNPTGGVISLLCRWQPCGQQLHVPPSNLEVGSLPKGWDAVAVDGQSPEARRHMKLQVPRQSHQSHCCAMLGQQAGENIRR